MIHAVLLAACSICFYGPDNMAFDRRGNVYVTDSDGGRRNRLLLLSRSGKKLGEYTGFTVSPGGHNGPEGLAVESSGTILVTDGGVPQVLRLNAALQRTGSIGPPSVHFQSLGHVAAGPSGPVYVADGAAQTIDVFDRNGTVRERWRGDWRMPETIALQPNGNLVVEDWPNRRIDVVSPRGRIVSRFGSRGRGPGRFVSTAGIGVDKNGFIYVVDIAEHRIQKFDASGRFVRFIGEGRFSKSGPSAVAIDNEGYLYSPDGLSIVKYTQSGKIVARWR